MTSRSSSRSSRSAAWSWSRVSAARTSDSGESATAASPPDRAAARIASPARRSADRRRLRASLATIRSSHGRNGASIPEAGERGEGLEEPVLDGIGGIGLRGDDVGGAHGKVLVAPYERLVGGDITSPGTADQSSVVQAGPPCATVPCTPPGSTRFPSGLIRSAPRGRSTRHPRSRADKLVRYDGRVTTGRVFRRSTVARPAGRGRGPRLDDPRRRRARVPRRGRRRDRGQRRSRTARDRRRHGRPGRSPRLRPRQRLHDRTARGVRPRGRRPPPDRRPGDLSRVGRLRGDRDGAQAGPRLPPRARRARALDRLSRGGGAITATPSAPWTCPDASRCAGRTRAGSAGSDTSRRPIRIGPAARAPTPSGDADDLAAELDRTFEAAGPGTVAAFVAEPIVGATLAAVVPPDGYWPADRRRLPPARRAAHRRRGHDRLRADRALVRARSLGRPAGHPRGGQGGDRRATGRSGSSPRRMRSTTAVTGGTGFVHGFTYSHAPVGAAVAREVLRILEARIARRGQRRQGRAAADAAATAAFGDHPAVGEIRGRGLLVGIELVADRVTREPFPRAARVTEAVVRAARERGRAGLLGDRQRQRRRRRHDPARAAVRGHRRRSSSGSPRRWRHRSRLPPRHRRRSPGANEAVTDGFSRSQRPVRCPVAPTRPSSGPPAGGTTQDQGETERDEDRRQDQPAESRHWRCSRRRSAPAGHRTRAASRTRRRSRRARRR